MYHVSMDSNWFSISQEKRTAIKYISENFYPAKYMNRWRDFKEISYKLSEIVKLYSSTQITEEIEHFEFFKQYFNEDTLDLPLPESYIKWFDSMLLAFRHGNIDEIASRFHMITEGILATVGLKILNETSMELPEFNFNIKKIIEDEARHINFGFQIIMNPNYAVNRIEELYPYAEDIIKDGMKYLEPIGYSWYDLRKLMLELKEARINKLKKKIMSAN
ncbi:hypothetical protein [Acidianus brierleyi]|nr:hypothetical protein [Acidianus brierleyi]